ncbi:MAG TPA: Na+/H+ antiporter subunit A [Bacillota bacterium]|nr:Na+/H+ antiporter subunit A [Bacillota bacterium]
MVTVNMAIFIPFIAAVLIPLLHKLFFSRIHIGWFVLIVPASLFIALLRFLPALAEGKTFTYTYDWIPSYGLNLLTKIDGLSMIFSLLITGIGMLVVLYSIYYLSTHESLRHFYCYLLLFMGSMLGVVFANHLLLLYVFWELTSISSFLLIAFWFHRKGSRYGAKKALLITISGGFAMLAGFLMVYVMTGTFVISDIIALAGTVSDHSLFLPAIILVLLGAFSKSAQFPFHIWLPDAMEAPTPVSAYLHSATMVKAGIYIVARFTPFFGGNNVWFWAVSIVGIVTLFWGSFSAIRQTDLKALLAYSTISQLGLIMCLFGLSSASLHPAIEGVIYTQAAFAALFHLVNHSTFKGALFMVVGIVDFQVGTRDIRRLGGLMALLPMSFTIAVIGSLSMAGLPPFNGFLSKEMFFSAILNVQQLNVFSIESVGLMFPIVAWIASVLTFVYSLIIIIQTFLGKYEPELLEREVSEPDIGMLIAPTILSVLVVGVFFIPNTIGEFLIFPAMLTVFPTLAQTMEPVHITAWHGFNTEIFMTAGVIVLGIILYRTLPSWRFIYQLFPERNSIDALYNFIITRSGPIGSRLTSTYMTGFLRHYLLYIFITLTLLVGSVMAYTGAFSISFVNNSPLHTFEVLLAIIITIAVITILFVKSRLPAILLNGLIGFSVAMLFVLFRAPDLALTQLVIETVTTALFLLSFYFLPDWTMERRRPRTKAFHLLVSIAVGLSFTLVALVVHNGKLFDSISVYFEDAYQLAGGKNIVNTILADFRAFDTMLEVVVLFIAGIGVYSLIKLKRGSEAKKLENK